MHLKQLKLAGFKSFVEPTVVPFSSQLVAVVGPNGCGKSNIIDAVRWVMGESSAKNLRGESMADVIFNGSSHRKSVGQATVELIFDNSLGRLVGQYASYQEIAVKRIVTRDGDSSYYLNGSRCRRRDITDIFLGTGAGARGYSIIGQDTISRLIEARPEDLRAYLEEAAGVSKYKERRRETLQRIAHTRENLARVADIRDELEKQLSRLERQAKAAARYQSLREEERLCKAHILALKWQGLSAEEAIVEHRMKALVLEHISHQTTLTGFIKENSQLQDALHQAQDAFQRVQVTFYQLNTEIARLEESIQQQLRERQRLMSDKGHAELEMQKARQQLQQDTDALNVCEQLLSVIEIDVQSLVCKFNEHRASLEDNELRKQTFDVEWQSVQIALHEAQRNVNVQQINLEHIEQRRTAMLLSLEKNQQERHTLLPVALQEELLSLQTRHSDLDKQQKIEAEEYQDCLKKGVGLRQELALFEQQLHQTQDRIAALATEHAVLSAAQNAALRKDSSASSSLSVWQEKPRFAELIHVPETWLNVCEWILGDGLQAIVLDSMETLWPSLMDLQKQSAIFILTKQASAAPATSYPRLSDKIEGPLPSGLQALDEIFAANSLSEAIDWLPTLNNGQSVVTPDGYWLGSGWVKIAGFTEQDESSVLRRRHALTVLNDALAKEYAKLSTLKAKRDEGHADVTLNDAKKNDLQAVLATSQEAFRVNDAALKDTQRALTHALTKIEALDDEKEALHVDIELLATQKIESIHQSQNAATRVEQEERHLQELLCAKTAWEETLTTLRQATNDLQLALHAAQLQANKETLKAQQLQTSILREQHHVTVIAERLESLAALLYTSSTPDNSLETSLKHKIAQHHQLNDELTCLRQQVEELQSTLSTNEQGAKQEEQAMSLLQEKIQQEQLQKQSIALRSESLVESLTALSLNVHDLLVTIAEGVTLAFREHALVDIEEKIKRLGAINLIAIEEYHTELERKQYLDTQYQDLTSALETLDVAIAKMDKETQLRLKDTFDQVNASFQLLFPRLFGGGRAMLELSCDNLLEAGILVMAQPPGKRNSTIHLLSGGEKAMTAVALVFAIFQLNPSPFCMLDEVDAPLDDLNVRRFCDLVKEMSKFVQFLFITHNKVTMELADHLIGVTMREPGVSRVVAVDVEEALSMAE